MTKKNTELESGKIKISEDEGDNSTNDLLIAYHTAVEKRIWMMSAELGKRPGEGE